MAAKKRPPKEPESVDDIVADVGTTVVKKGRRVTITREQAAIALMGLELAKQLGYPIDPSIVPEMNRTIETLKKKCA